MSFESALHVNDELVHELIDEASRSLWPSANGIKPRARAPDKAAMDRRVGTVRDNGRTTGGGKARKPGTSARVRFHQLRIQKLKSDWRLWLGFAGMTVVAVSFIIFLGTLGIVLGAWMLGFITAIGVFGWMIGFDVHTLPWLWGSWGEEQTGEELAKLGPDWYVAHDIANDYGNWDHVLVGPSGVFMIDTKSLSGKVTINGDGLASGRTRYAAKTFRGAAVGLREALQAHVGTCPWVQAVVAIWGDFPERIHHGDRVVFVAGSDLAAWLNKQPAPLDRTRARRLADAVESLARAG